MTSFQPTHLLISPTREVPVAVVPNNERSVIYTEAEWGRTQAPAFEVHAKLGIFCRGIKVLGHRLEPITVEAPVSRVSSAV